MSEDHKRLQNMNWAEIQKLGKELNCPPLYLSHQVFRERLVKVILVRIQGGCGIAGIKNSSPKKAKRSSRHVQKTLKLVLPGSKECNSPCYDPERLFSPRSDSTLTPQKQVYKSEESWIDENNYEFKENNTIGSTTPCSTSPSVKIIDSYREKTPRKNGSYRSQRTPRKADRSPRKDLWKTNNLDSSPGSDFVNIIELWQQRDSIRQAQSSSPGGRKSPSRKERKSGRKSGKPKVVLVSQQNIITNQVHSDELTPTFKSKRQQVSPTSKFPSSQHCTARGFQTENQPKLVKAKSSGKRKPKRKKHKALASSDFAPARVNQECEFLKKCTVQPLSQKRSPEPNKVSSPKKVLRDIGDSPLKLKESLWKTCKSHDSLSTSKKVQHSMLANENAQPGFRKTSGGQSIEKTYNPLKNLQQICPNQSLVDEDVNESSKKNQTEDHLAQFSKPASTSKVCKRKSNTPITPTNEVLSIKMEQNSSLKFSLSDLNPPENEQDQFMMGTPASLGKQVTKEPRRISKRLPIFTPTPVKNQAVKPVLGDFDLLKEIGRGAFGKVYQVKHKKSRKIYAMKVLKKRKLVERNQVEHTKTERYVLELSQHPFCVTLRFAFQNPKKLYLVMDFYRGGELFNHLQKKRRFKERTARLMIAEITLALGHLHRHGVIYRDLKPENVLIDQEGHIAITDFGLSKCLKRGEAARTFCGTPEYLAPEVITGVGHDKNVDWWSVGILCYELVIGIPPFYSQNLSEMYHNIKHKPLSWRRREKTLSRELMEFVSLLLDRNPRSRLGAGTEDVNELLSHDFFYSLDFKKVLAKEVKPIYRPSFEGGRKNLLDTSNFDTAKVRETYVDESEISRTDEQNYFDCFTYQPEKIMGGVV